MIKAEFELWKQIKVNNNYEVSTEGRLRRKLKSGGYRYIKGSADKDGYMKLSIDGKYYRLHRLVCEAFKKDYSDELLCDHINGDVTDNRSCNLRMVDHKVNTENRHIISSSKRYKVEQCDLEGNVINTWKTATEAGRALGIDARRISERCNGKGRTYKGYIWRKVEEYEK